nr:uncharacterized protein LOC121823568 [Peromyscus maniculatus bairdii]
MSSPTTFVQGSEEPKAGRADLQAEAHCPVCKKYFKDPVTIECGHNCCLACIREFWKDLKDCFPCPVCHFNCPERSFRSNGPLGKMTKVVTPLPVKKTKKRKLEEEYSCEIRQKVPAISCEKDQQLPLPATSCEKDQQLPAISCEKDQQLQLRATSCEKDQQLQLPATSCEKDQQLQLPATSCEKDQQLQLPATSCEKDQQLLATSCEKDQQLQLPTTSCEKDQQLQPPATSCEKDQQLQLQATSCEKDQQLQLPATSCEKDQQLQLPATSCEKDQQTNSSSSRPLPVRRTKSSRPLPVRRTNSSSSRPLPVRRTNSSSSGPLPVRRTNSFRPLPVRRTNSSRPLPARRTNSFSSGPLPDQQLPATSCEKDQQLQLPTTSCEKDQQLPATSCEKDQQLPATSCEKDQQLQLPATSCEKDQQLQLPTTSCEKDQQLQLPTTSCEKDQELQLQATSCEKDQEFPATSCEKDQQLPATSCEDQQLQLPATSCEKDQQLPATSCEEDHEVPCPPRSLVPSPPGDSAWPPEKAALGPGEHIECCLKLWREKVEPEERTLASQRRRLLELKKRAERRREELAREYQQHRLCLRAERENALERLQTEEAAEAAKLQGNLARFSDHIASLKCLWRKVKRKYVRPELELLTGLRDCYERPDSFRCPDVLAFTLQEYRYRLPPQCSGLDRIIRRFQVDVRLDPGTAYCKLAVSEDRKAVQYGGRQRVPYSSKRFQRYPIILGSEGYSSGRQYWEVDVECKNEWVVGVCKEPFPRSRPRSSTSTFQQYSVQDGLWAVGLNYWENYFALGREKISLLPSVAPNRVGIFLDSEMHEVSFYNLRDKSLLYSFSDCASGALWPYFYVGYHLTPLKICTVEEPEP